MSVGEKRSASGSSWVLSGSTSLSSCTLGSAAMHLLISVPPVQAK